MLLLDQNLSHHLVARLADVFPDSQHVRAVDLSEADDRAVWAFARETGRTLVSQDGDFADLAVLRGVPPHVVWLRVGNRPTAEVETVLRAHAEAIRALPTSGRAVLMLR